MTVDASPPPTTGTRALRARGRELALYVALPPALGALQWEALHRTGAWRASLLVTMSCWALVGVGRHPGVQRWIGGGRLDNRQTLRALLAGLMITAMLAPSSLPWLVPVAMPVVTVVHTEWSGHQAWRPTAVAFAVLTIGVEVAVHRGWLPSATSPQVADLVAITCYFFSLFVAVNLALVVRDRQRSEAELARERDRSHAALEHAATHDRLTDLLDRRGLNLHLAASARTRRSLDAGLAVLFCDLDGFKAVNDSLGHTAGDAVLVAVADRLRSCVRGTDLVARLGGDEFLVVLGFGDEAAVRELADRLEVVICQPYDLPQGRVRIGVSIGVAICTAPAAAPSTHGAAAGVDLEALIVAADAAMYDVKTQHHRGRERLEAAAAPGGAPSVAAAGAGAPLQGGDG